LFPCPSETVSIEAIHIPEQFKQTRYLEFIGFGNLQEGLKRVKHHKIDFLLRIGPSPYQYWISDTSPKGYVIEKIFSASLAPPVNAQHAVKKEIAGPEIRYLDWLFPGILAMNMMFSALWGVGYVVVRYRKNGVLKRLKATPLTAFEYLSAQLLSRIFLLMFTLIVVWIGCDLIFSFRVEGTYLDLLIVFFIGGLSLTALGLLVASRGTSEEFTSGVLNFITWPMMFLSEVWFSLEGAPQWVKLFSQLFPLTHMIRAARSVMNDGATLAQVSTELTLLVLLTFVFLAIGSSLFSWNR
jgi:ABC-type multidrug transport system permease subunit